MAESFDGTLGSDPEHQDRPHRWLDSSILHGASLRTDLISSRSQKALWQSSPDQKWDPVFHEDRDERSEHHQGSEFREGLVFEAHGFDPSKTRAQMRRGNRSYLREQNRLNFGHK
jgi:hypothetical protein